jgi:hypothetical protein
MRRSPKIVESRTSGWYLDTERNYLQLHMLESAIRSTSTTTLAEFC